jgi:hypothetical protein
LKVRKDRTLLSQHTAATVTDLINDITLSYTAGGSNRITLVANTTFQLSVVNNTTDGPTGLPVIATGDKLTIAGSGGDVIDRGSSTGTAPAFRLLDVAQGATLRLEDLTLTGGLAFGAVYSQGTLDLNGVTVAGNTASGSSGAPGSAGQNAAGGGIYANGGSVTLQPFTPAGSTTAIQTVLKGNHAYGGSGGGFSSSTVKGKAGGAGGNASGGGLGGGLDVGGGSATLTSDTVQNNFAKGGAGGTGGAAALGQAGASGSAGLASGSGIYIVASGATVSIDSSSVQQAQGNSPDNIVGPHT